MEAFVVLFPGVCALFGASAANPCLDPTDANYSCEVDEFGDLDLGFCDITDEDVDGGDLASCLDNAGQEFVEELYLWGNAFTTLPAGIFDGLTALTGLTLGDNPLTTLPAGIFEGLTALENLNLNNNGALTTLPAGIFDGLTALGALNLNSNALTTLPAGIFDGVTGLGALDLDNNALTTLPAGIFEGLAALVRLMLYNNALTTLPAGIFEGLTALEYLNLDENELDCLPITPSTLVEVDDDSGVYGIHVDFYGDECGCSVANVTDNVCGEESCIPGPVGYTCGLAVFFLTPAPVPAATASPVAATTAPEGSGETEAPAPLLAATSPAPTPAPSVGITSTIGPVTTPPEQKSVSDSTPMIAGIISAVVGAALIALLLLRKRRRDAKQETVQRPSAPPAHHGDNLEQGRDQPHDVHSPVPAVLAVGSGGDESHSQQRNASPHRHTPAEADEIGDGDIVPPSPAPSRDEQVSPSAEHANNSAEPCGARLASDGSAEKFLAATTASTANLSTAERDNLSQSHQRERVAAPFSGGPKSEDASGGDSRASLAAGHQNSAGIGLGRAVLAAAEELVHHCQIPGVSEAATAVCMMANLATDSRDNARASESTLRQCSTVVMALKRAAKVADKGGDTIGEVARGMIEDVHGAIFDLVQLIKTYQSKNRLSRLFLSTLFKRRQEELDAVVDQAIMRLQLGLQLRVGQDVGALKERMDLYQLSLSEAASESVAEARRIKRQRKLDQVEIPAEYVSITDELLGKGGFGEVYLADYNGLNVAAKVMHIAQMGVLDETQKQRVASQHRAFLRELEAMIRLRNLNTVNVFGAVTSLPDRMVLVMELLPGGDLLSLLRKSKKALPEEQSRRIIRDICTGMVFLHSKNTVHGDLKSANVLLDGDGKAKIADFGTSRWTQTTTSNGLATYTTKSSQTTHMSIAWSAPEVLDSGRSSYMSDVYSFGIVVWEVLSRELPWANKARPSEILTAVVLRGARPSFHVDAPADIVDIAKACWAGQPEKRTTFSAILEGMNAKGWSE